MSPHVRRTWAPIGKTPILYQRTRSRERVSMIAALTVSPHRHRVGLYFSLLPNQNVTTETLTPFVRQLRAQLGGRIYLVWDRLTVHRSTLARLRQRRAKIHAVFLPPYAPELNPVEALWAYLKMNPLANLPATDAEHLRRRAHQSTQKIRANQALLRSFIRATPLSLRLR